MKKHYATIFILLLTSLFSVKAQCIPDESIKSTGIFYDDQVPFCVNELYNEVYQLAVTNDTTIVYGGFTIPANVDSSEIISVSGMPNGLTYSCPTENCKIINSGGDYSHNCMNVTGIPTILGDYTVIFTFRLYGLGNQIDQKVELSLEVTDCTPTGISSDISSRKNISVYPQPAKSNANLEVILNSSSNVTVTIHNLLGQEISKAFNGTLSAGTNKISISEYISNLDSGLYMITTDISNSGKSESYTKRLVID